mmetsp:Transcript_27953/g.39716  ORF Transcript_27953/g.39716 Transcript_27953/m.39716 type:complete len:92 (+) Transcript_27953:662-937(+)
MPRLLKLTLKVPKCSSSSSFSCVYKKKTADAAVKWTQRDTQTLWMATYPNFLEFRDSLGSLSLNRTKYDPASAVSAIEVIAVTSTAVHIAP